MKIQRTLYFTVAAGAALAAGGCLAPTKTTPPIESAGNAVDRYVAAVEASDQWRVLPAMAARLMMVKYGVPDEVYPDHLAWVNNGPWRRTVVWNARPSSEEGKDLGVVEQTVGYVLTAPQAENLAAFDHRLIVRALRGELSASSDREEYNFLRLNLADDVAHGRLNPQQARDAYFQAVALDESGKTSPDLHRLRLTDQ